MKLKELEESVKKANEAGIQLGYYSNDDVLALIETVKRQHEAILEAFDDLEEIGDYGLCGSVDTKDCRRTASDLQSVKNSVAEQWGLGGEGE